MRHLKAVEARAFFDHDTQRRGGMIEPHDLHDNGIEYWAEGHICVAFHLAHWSRVWMAHYGVKPEGWGHLKEPAVNILRAFWKAKQPELIIGWTRESNRAAISFARRLGFVEHGKMVLPSGTVVLQEWRP